MARQDNFFLNPTILATVKQKPILRNAVLQHEVAESVCVSLYPLMSALPACTQSTRGTKSQFNN